jgi:hypothetical protein
MGYATELRDPPLYTQMEPKNGASMGNATELMDPPLYTQMDAGFGTLKTPYTTSNPSMNFTLP